MNTNGNPETDSQDDFEDVVARHFDAGCSECMSSRDAYWHELEWANEGQVNLLEREINDLKKALETHRSALQRLTNPVAVANCAQALADTRVKLSIAQSKLARIR